MCVSCTVYLPQQQVSMSSGVNMSGAALGLGYVGVESVSRLNPRAPDFAQRHPLMQQKHNAQVTLIAIYVHTLFGLIFFLY